MKHYMKHIMLIFIIALSMVTGTFPVSANEESLTDDEVIRTIEELNGFRSVYGLPSLSYSEILNKTANIHSKYMDFNNSYSSLEEAGKLYYRGRYPWDRAEYAGYEKSYVFEALMKDLSNYSSGIDYLLQNPYSRYALFDPLYEDLGMNMHKDYTTYLFGGASRKDNMEVVYPYNKQENVQTAFTNKYIQDPYQQVAGEYETVGIPITYSFYLSDAKILEYSDLEVSLLNTRTNEYVDIKVLSANDDRKLTNTIMILPLEAYDYGTTYEVSIKGFVRFNNGVIFKNSTSDLSSYRKTINYEGTFTTVNTSAVNNDVSFITREKFIVDLMKIEVSAAHYVLRDSLEIIFRDVNINDSNYRYLYTAYSNKLIKGYTGDLFKPDANINREQAYTILMRNYISIFGNITLSEDDKNLQFSDKDSINDWAYDMILAAKKIGLLNDNKYTFDPQEYITVSEFNKILDDYVEVSSTTPNIRN